MAKAPQEKQQASSASEKQAGNKPKPAKEFRAGRLRITLWENHHETQGVWFSCAPTRSYRDKSGQWQSASTVGMDDLLPLAQLCQQAWLWLQEQRQARRSAGQEHEAPANGDAPF